MDVTFDVGRYLGVYIDFSQDTQTGIWMATGHALAADAADNEVERAYIKTVENSLVYPYLKNPLSCGKAQ